MERLARLVMRHRRIVGALWLVLFVGGLMSAGQLKHRWSLDFSLPGQPGDNAQQQLIHTYGVSSIDTYLAVVTVPAGQTVEADRSAVAAIIATCRRGRSGREAARRRLSRAPATRASSPTTAGRRMR